VKGQITHFGERIISECISTAEHCISTRNGSKSHSPAILDSNQARSVHHTSRRTHPDWEEAAAQTKGNLTEHSPQQRLQHPRRRWYSLCVAAGPVYCAVTVDRLCCSCGSM
jgi:hypothetical protein